MTTIGFPVRTEDVEGFPFAYGDEMDQPTFHALYKDLPPNQHAELIGGVVYIKMPTTVDHARPHSRAVEWLGLYAKSTPGTESFGAITDKLGPLSQPEPDACLLLAKSCGGKTYFDGRGYLTGPPELIVEVANSTMTVDLGRKKRDYEEYGVREYTVVLPLEQKIAWFGRKRNGFVDIPPDEMGIYRSVIYPGLWLDPAGLFTSNARKIIRTLRKGLASPEHAAFVASQEKKLAAAAKPKKKR